MKIERAVNLQDQMIARLTENYAMAEICGWTSSQIQQRNFETIFNRLAELKAPQWIASFINGYEKCLIDNLYHNKLIYGVFVDKKFLSAWPKHPDYYENHSIDAKTFNDIVDNNKDKAGHYWIHNLKPYFCG